MNIESPGKPGTAFCDGRFTINEKVGEGTYGEVYFATDNFRKTKVALKKVKFHGNEGQGIPPTTIREIAILKELKHKNIVGLDDVIMTNGLTDHPGLYLVFKMMDCDLKKLMKYAGGRLNLAITKQILYQILEGVDFLHENKVFHRDLKPENVLVSREDLRIKICDFGLARTVHQPLRPYTQEVLSLWYRAPEMCISNRHYSVGVDTWAIGCIFAEMVSGRPLFPAKQPSELLLLIVKVLGNPPSEFVYMPPELKQVMKNISNVKSTDLKDLIPGLDKDGLDLLKRLLCLNPLARLTCKQALSHPFFKDLKI